jgi:hypothetical protein
MSAWAGEADRLALLELWATGRLKRRRQQEAAWARLDGERWTSLTSRSRERALAEGYRSMIEQLLDQAWPLWRKVHADLTAAGLPPTPEGWRALQERMRIAAAPPLPAQVLHHKTAASLVGPDSKASWTAGRRAATNHLTLTHDTLLRLRPSRGLVLMRHGASIEADAVHACLGELVLSDRSMRDSLAISMPPRVLLSVENLGAYVDLPSVANDWMIAHVPGWNTVALADFLNLLPASTIWCHWGDLDPQGVAIMRSLRTIRADVRWIAPEWWPQVAPAQRGDWSGCLEQPDDPPLVRHLRAAGTWLEQEPLVIDQRLPGTLRKAAWT